MADEFPDVASRFQQMNKERDCCCEFDYVATFIIGGFLCMKEEWKC